MFSAAQLIEALHRRLRLVAPHLRRPPGEFPPGWQAWLATLRERPGVVTGAPAEMFVDVLRRRPLVKAPRALAELTRWQAFSTLWRQQWHPVGPEDRRSRWFAAAVTLAWHLLVGSMLVWLMHAQFVASRPSPEGETVVQVEWIGAGTPEEVGGGAEAPPADAGEPSPPATVTPRPSPMPAPPSRAAPPVPTEIASETPVLDAPVPPVERRDVPELQPAAPAQQVLTVSEPAPDRDDVFVLPPPTPRLAQPQAAAPTLRADAPTVQVVEVPAPVSAPTVPQPTVRLPAPGIRSDTPEVVVREVPAPTPVPMPRTVNVPAPAVPPVTRSAIPAVRTATIPTPASPATAAVAAPTRAVPATPGAAASASPSKPSTSAAAADGRSPTATTAGVGPKPAAAAGAWPTTRRGDDWADSTRNTPGGQRGLDGLYNADGSVRLADAPGSASSGQPPGMITEEIRDLDRAGTWLRRPPVGYEPTKFDRYWRPNETLLAEWVRKSITTVRIPIPGTNKHIVCQTVLLALGGGCGITDPNLNEQPATARPPPDIPFKPELQEDNGAVVPPSS